MSQAPVRTVSPMESNSPLSNSALTAEHIPYRTLADEPTSGYNQVSRPVPENYPIIVHCHLCWDWVWQRPQQFLSRLSERHRILFVETVAPDRNLVNAVARLRQEERFPNITILRLQFPEWRWSDGKYVDQERRRLVQEAVRGPLAGQFDQPVQWFYDPMAVSAFAGHMNEIATVYDCMDELSKFRFAPPEIIQRENGLLSRADVVFTGGYGMWENKRKSNQNCFFYGCGVDVDHFGKARSPETPIADDLAKLPKPVLGYFGVVDERMDYDLIASLADANPNWSVVIVGPVAKVDPATFPKRPNLHWLGGREYKDLPRYCKGFDICLMPFALNESTQYINPTKALEYMAAGRVIVSSAVPDVVRNFGSVVKVANSPDEFVQMCKEAATSSNEGPIKAGLKMAGENTWESIVAKLEGHIRDALTAKAARAA